METRADKFERWAIEWADKLPNLAKALRSKDLQQDLAAMDTVTLLIDVAISVVNYSKGADPSDAWVEVSWETVNKAVEALRLMDKKTEPDVK